MTQDGDTPSGVHRTPLARDAEGENSNAIEMRPGFIGSGANSGFQALNLAIQFGAARIILLGYDMKANGHWHGAHVTGLGNPADHSARQWRDHFAANADLIRSLGVEVINATPGSALTCFSRATLDSVV